jgi:hypothetical protein
LKKRRFGNLTNSIQDAINSSITTLKTKFENNDPPTAVTQYTRLGGITVCSTFSFSGKYSGSESLYRVAAKRCL